MPLNWEVVLPVEHWKLYREYMGSPAVCDEEAEVRGHRSDHLSSNVICLATTAKHETFTASELCCLKIGDR